MISYSEDCNSIPVSFAFSVSVYSEFIDWAGFNVSTNTV